MKHFILACILSIFFSGLFVLGYADDTKSNTKADVKTDSKPDAGKTGAEAAKGSKDLQLTKEKPAPKVAQKQPLGFFHSIILKGIGDLHITQADEADFTIEAEPKIQALIKAHVEDQVLYIDMKDASEHSQSKVTYYLKIKTLQAITSYVDATINIKDGFETKVLSVSLLSGFGEANLNVDVTKLTAKIAGAGKMNIQGVADELEVSINGIGEFMGNKLKSKLATVNISGSGIAKVSASEDLIIKLTGNGVVQYCGKPNVTKDVKGNGTVSESEASECS